MPICPQCHDFLKPDATQCPECGWGKTPTTQAAKHSEREAAWSPPTPAFHDEPWRHERRMTPAEVEPYLAELRAIAARTRPASAATAVDPDQTARYLAACAARRATAA